VSAARAETGCVKNFRIEYFRDGILIKAAPSHKARDEAIETARAGLVACNAQLAIIRDWDAGNVEVARITS
jgi:hypothetical protein